MLSSRCETRAGLRARRLLTLSFFFCFSLLSPRFLYAWGEAGHRIIADIAEQHLSEQAHKEIRSLIGEASLASIADWADRIRGDRAETAHWHYVNIPFQASRYERKRDCAGDDCVIAAVKRFRAILSDRNRPAEERAEALKFLVHLVADLHQPLHTTDHDDRGGNDLPVFFFGEEIHPFSGKPWTLHAVWDGGLIDHTGLTEAAYVAHLRGWLKKRSTMALQKGTIVDWALEGHRAAVDAAYRLPRDRKLSKDYFEKSIPVMDELLAKAGVRLARVLNEAFRRK